MAGPVLPLLCACAPISAEVLVIEVSDPPCSLPQFWVLAVNTRKTGKGPADIRIKGIHDPPRPSLCA